MQVFAELGHAIATAWNRLDRSEADFPGVADSLLTRSRLLKSVTPEQIVEWCSETDEELDQGRGSFGQPAINLFHDRDFYIQALFWVDATTSIHEHNFSGAFGVLAGSSVHTQYEFHVKECNGTALEIGDLRFASTELLTQGDVRAIKPNGLPHALFHLDPPSVSVVIRTRGCSKQRPQYDFFKPGIAIDPRYDPDMDRTRLRLLETLARVNSPMVWSSAATMLRQADMWMSFHVLQLLSFSQETPEHIVALAEIIGSKHGESALATMQQSLEAAKLEEQISQLRTHVHDPQHRFFLALLLNLPGRAQIYSLIAKRYSCTDPEPLVMRWLGEIFKEPQVGIQLSPANLQTFQQMLCESASLEAADESASLEAAERLTPAHQELEHPEDMRQHLAAMSLLQPLLRL